MKMTASQKNFKSRYWEAEATHYCSQPENCAETSYNQVREVFKNKIHIILCLQ